MANGTQPLGLQTNQQTAADFQRLRTPSAPAPLNLNLGSRNQPSQSGLFQLLTPREASAAGLGGIGAGLSVNPQTTSSGAAAFDVLGAITSGAIAGAPGGPIGSLIGGGIGGLIGAGKAFFSVSQARKAARERKRLAQLAEKAQAQAIRREEEWNRRMRVDTLEQRAQNRRDQLVQQGWIDYQNKLNIMNNFVAQNRQGQQDLLGMLQPVRT